MKVFQVTSDWTVFRIPIKNYDGDKMYCDMAEWLKENCSGTYKLFLISHGIIENSNYRNGGYGDYKPLLEIDLLSDVDVMAFKLRWIE